VLTLLLVGGTQAAHARQHHVPVNGTCGSSNLAKLSSAPTANLCATGTASAVTVAGHGRGIVLAATGGRHLNVRLNFL
jgi:hypothetical protein